MPRCALSLFNPTARVPLPFLSSPRSSVAVFSGSSLQNTDLCISVLVSSESSWQPLQAKMFVESRVNWWIGAPTLGVWVDPQAKCTIYLAHGSTYV